MSKFVSILKKSTSWIPKPQRRASAYALENGQLENLSSPTVTVAVSLNSNNPAVALPTEILRTIFLCVIIHSLPVSVKSITATHVRPPKWITITQVCRRWRYVAQGMREPWTIITQDLSPMWIVALLQRSSYSPTQISIDLSTLSPLKKPLKKPFVNLKRHPRKQPLTKLPSITIEEIFSHASHVQSLHLMGTVTDIIQTLMLLDGRTPLVSLSIHLLRTPVPSHRDYVYEDGHEDNPVTSIILPEDFLGGRAPHLRSLQSHSGLYLTFPSWFLGALSEFTVSHNFDVKKLFVALRQMPQLEVLRLLPQLEDPFFYGSSSDEVTAPVHLNNLNLLVFVDSYLELLVDLLSCLSAPPSVRRHFKLTLNGHRIRSRLWKTFSSLMCEAITVVPDPPHGVHLIHDFHGTSVRIWAKPRLIPSLWPPLHDLYSFDIHYPRHLPWDPKSYRHSSSFHRLQRFCADLGGPSVQELSVDCHMGPYFTYVQKFPKSVWRPLFNGFPSLRTLRFGAGATEVLASLSKAIIAGPFVEEEPNSKILSSSLQQVIIGRGEFCTRILWRWIHYAFALPPETNILGLREYVLASLSNPCRIPAEVDPMEVATTELLIFLLRCGSRDDSVLKFTLVECKWDEPDGLEILRLLFRFLDWNVILESTSSD